MTHYESYPPWIYLKKKKRWLTTTIFLSVTCYNVTMLTTNYYNDFFEFGQQKINFSFFELSLPDDDPVYTLKKVMEELDFSGLLANCSDKGRTGYNPIMMYAVVTYANMREYVLLTVLLICVKETLLLSGWRADKNRNVMLFMTLRAESWHQMSWMTWITSLCDGCRKKGWSH